MRSLIIATLAGMAVASPGWPHPTMEIGNSLANLGWTPMPTEGPSMEILQKRIGRLQQRQASLSSGQLVGYFAQDSICGYISGSIGAAVGCSSASRCAAIAPIGGSPGAVGCCPLAGSGCYFVTRCYNYAQIQSSSCDAGCLQDQDVRACTNSASPYCFASSWADISATIWGCNAQSLTSTAPISLNFLGATSTKTWSAYYYTPSASSSNPIVSAVSSIRSSSSTSSSASSSPTPSPVSKSSTNVGAIVGGVIGGLAVLALLAFGIVFLLLRKRKAKHNAATAASVQNQTDNHPHGQPPMGQHGGYGAPLAGGAAGAHYGENKAPVSATTSPGPSPGQGYVQPAAGYKDPNTPYDGRASHYSETGSPVPQYQPNGAYQQTSYDNQIPAATQHQGAVPMELHGDSSQHIGPNGQIVHEVPAEAPANR